MKYLKLFFFLLLSSCATTMTKHGDEYTIEKFTGTHGQSMYVTDFFTKADEICPNGFDIKDRRRGRTKYHFEWVIKCK